MFFVYPTLFGGTGKMNMDISDTNMQLLVHTALLKHGAIFKNNCNVYAPYYRQMVMDAASTVR